MARGEGGRIRGCGTMVAVGWVGSVRQDFKVEENRVTATVASDDVGSPHCLRVAFCGARSSDRRCLCSPNICRSTLQ